MKIAKLTQELQRLTVFIESRDLRLQRFPGLVKEASRLQDKISKSNTDIGRLLAEKNAVIAL